VSLESLCTCGSETTLQKEALHMASDVLKVLFLYIVYQEALCCTNVSLEMGEKKITCTVTLTVVYIRHNGLNQRQLEHCAEEVRQ